jgi:hypothetical protein
MDGAGSAASAVQGRAVQAMIWGIPAVNYDAMFQAFCAAGGGANQMVFWSRLCDWHNQTLTPNTDTLYLIPFFDTADAGPMVLEIPAAGDIPIVGSVMDCWQTALDDVGIAGADQGAGGKYLILPPGYPDPVPDGYIPLRSSTHAGYALLRAVPKDDSRANVDQAVAYLKTVRLYPLSAAADPPAPVLLDAADLVFDAAIPYDLRFFESLDRIVQAEPWLDRDRVMIDILRSVGIRKGALFAPDQAAVVVLESALAEARSFLDAGYESYPRYYQGRQWFLPGSPELFQSWGSGYTVPDSYPVDGRGVTYYWRFSSVRRVGQDMHQTYLFATRGQNGQTLDGSNAYRLTVPPDVPASQYWSVALYNRDTHTLIRDVDYAARSSLTPGLAVNPDGSTDLSFGPTWPDGSIANFIPTRTGEQFEVIFRVYGVQKPLLDKTWVLPDIEEVAR